MSSQEHYPSTYDGLLQLVERLRGRDGCPWDREQTHDSLKRVFLEECYELVEAVEQNDVRKMVEELGDVLFNVVFQVRIAEEAGEFTHEEVFDSLIGKLVRRHHHVFGDVQVADAREVKANWDNIKRDEMKGTGDSILDGVPRRMPALSYAQAVQERAARAGFDWDDLGGVLEKLAEEMEELREAQSRREREQELGDLLFSLVNVARWMGADAEGALRQTNARFYRRYVTMERLSRERGLSFSELSPDEQEALWREAKMLEESGSAEQLPAEKQFPEEKQNS